ncbi:MAG: hypothetical protein IPJ38_15605 [Dechloromonas sp.]|uniref:Uncharacterized protein n=1 Tax=Candidatus Dechloromonas phosphorivorans TaxID=2899244 RepID=A0A935KBF0_9RHOO|nr:hypothetical protein [Candidatus Dechloromonas phosphorivorans]
MNFGKLSSEDLRLFLNLAEAFDMEFVEARNTLIQSKSASLLRLFEASPEPPLRVTHSPGMLHKGLNHWAAALIQQLFESPNQIQCPKMTECIDAEMDAWEQIEEKNEMRKSLAAIYAFSHSMLSCGTQKSLALLERSGNGAGRRQEIGKGIVGRRENRSNGLGLPNNQHLYQSASASE